jgi:hypothetical protein
VLEGSATFGAQGATFTGDALTIGGTGNADIVSSTFPEAIILTIGSEAIVHISNSRFWDSWTSAGPGIPLHGQESLCRHGEPAHPQRGGARGQPLSRHPHPQ